MGIRGGILEENVWEVRRVGWEETRGLLSPVRESGKFFGKGGFNGVGLVPFGQWKAPVKPGPPDPSYKLDQPMGGAMPGGSADLARFTLTVFTEG